MIRVVLDTNVIVSLGPPARILALVIDGAVRLCLSGDVYTEYEEVIRRPRFNRDESVIRRHARNGP